MIRSLANFGILFLYCMLPFCFFSVQPGHIAGMLLIFSILSINYYFDAKFLATICLFVYFLISLFYPDLLLFTPLFFLLIQRWRLYYFIPIYTLICYSLFFQDNTPYFLHLIIGMFLGLYLCFQTEEYYTLHHQLIKLHDDDKELNIILHKQNVTLQKNQDFAVQNAMLQERNRIAREIHDNVGHMLSRCILITGALKAINKEENCKESIELLDTSLSQAMTSIRNSVHNLHDDSINLESSMKELIQNYSFCNVSLDYDMSKSIPNKLKYAFLNILKEAMTNTAKHSNATLIQVTVREHPVMYQLIIHDNGHSKNIKKIDISTPSDYNGIGLCNMYDRIKGLNGILRITQDNGFQIFVSVPKKSIENKGGV